jgi:hypothetical protein
MTNALGPGFCSRLVARFIARFVARLGSRAQRPNERGPGNVVATMPSLQGVHVEVTNIVLA